MKVFCFSLLASLLLLLLLGQGATEAQGGFSDSFHSASLDTTRWEVYVDGMGSATPQTDGLHLTLTSENNGPVFVVNVTCRCLVQGDFDAQVEYRLVGWPPAKGIGTGLGADSVPLPVAVHRASWPDGREVYLTQMADGWQGITDTTDTVGRLRLTRTGNTLTGYRYSSGSWVPLHSHTDPSHAIDTVIGLRIWGNVTTPGVEVVLENFSVAADSIVFPTPGPFTPTFLETGDEFAPDDPYDAPADDACPVSAPCKTLYAEDVPDGQAVGGMALLLPSSIVAFAADPIVPDGAIVGRVYGSVRLSEHIGVCGSMGTVEPYEWLWLEGTIDPATTTGSSSDLYSPFHWPIQLNRFRDDILAGNPGAVLHSRWLKGTEGWAVNALWFKLADGSLVAYRDVRIPGEQACGPLEVRSIYLGLSADNPATPGDEGGVPLFTCSSSGLQTYRLALDRGDTPEWDPVVLEDPITCSPNTPAGSDVSVPLNGGTDVLAGMDVTFSSVTTSGSTSVVTRTEGPPPPPGFEIVGLGELPLYFDINTDAYYSGELTVCVRYDETQVAGPEAGLKLMQRIDDNYVDVTASVDTVSNTICGTTTHLSIFVVAEPLAAVGGTVEIAGHESASLAGSAADSSAGSAAWYYAALAGGAAAAALALTAGAWYARRRWGR